MNLTNSSIAAKTTTLDRITAKPESKIVEEDSTPKRAVETATSESSLTPAGKRPKSPPKARTHKTGHATHPAGIACSKMNGKPVLHREVATVLSLDSEEFQAKLLCDGLVLNLGDACAFSCSYCFTQAQMRKIDQPIINAFNRESGQSLGHQDVVIRRAKAIEILRGQLLQPDGSPCFDDPDDNRVVFTSSTVDPGANMKLLRETAEACNLILNNTAWQIRILSKSALLRKLIENELIPEAHHSRLILGFSIGTLNDRLASSIERGTSRVSKRLESLHWLQDRGIRTFGMICPNLPQEDYDTFSREVCEAIRVGKCEHVWAEAMNVRGESLKNTAAALRQKGFEAEARRLEEVFGPGIGDQWEHYARDTFLAHTRQVPADKLRFLQYVTAQSADWWADRRPKGAVPIGKVAHTRAINAPGESAPAEQLPKLKRTDIQYRTEREKIVGTGLKASIAAAQALHEIHDYRDGILWRNEFSSFEQYCESKWAVQKSQAYRSLRFGRFIAKLPEPDSPKGECLPVPTSEGQIRKMLEDVPEDHWRGCWSEITADYKPAEMTGPMVAESAGKYVRKHKLARKKAKTREKPDPGARLLELIGKLRRSSQTHSNRTAIFELLGRLEMEIATEAGATLVDVESETL